MSEKAILDAENCHRLSLRAFEQRMPAVKSRPSDTWFSGFINRRALADKLGKSSANLTMQDLKGWFERVFNALEESENEEILQDPSRIENADESFFLLYPTSEKIVIEKGVKNAYEISANDKKGITVMCTFRADGIPCDPFIVFPYERIPKALNEGFPHNRAKLAATKSG